MGESSAFPWRHRKLRNLRAERALTIKSIDKLSSGETEPQNPRREFESSK